MVIFLVFYNKKTILGKQMYASCFQKPNSSTFIGVLVLMNLFLI